mmetsp:Transcript_30521/g.81411  ORF Transcript_30521/g.81411 Transcript_30521/m.81411 type:complete len:243 (+) Transcript_30521:494-1222(+)
MPTELSTRHVLVDTRFVSEEVSIHSERRLHRSVGHDLLLNVLGRHGINALAVESWLRLLSLIALGSRLAWPAGLKVRGVDVVLTRREDIRVLLFRCQAMAFEKMPCPSRETTVAAIPALKVTARKHILRRQLAGICSIACNANSVRHSLNSTERPARPASGLISDVSNARAVRPSCAGIKLRRNCQVLVMIGRRSLLTTLQGSHQCLNISNAHHFESRVASSLPTNLLGVDEVHCTTNQTNE